MKSAPVATFVLLTLLLSGCTTLDTLPYFNRSANEANASSASSDSTKDTLGIAVSQTKPPTLESITFFTETLFSKKTAKICVQEPLADLNEDTDASTHYLGLDVLTTSGAVSGESRRLGISVGRYQITFNLALLGQHNGTHYGFSQLRLAKQNKLNLSSHDLRPILANSSDSKLVYQALDTLFRELDACAADDTATTESS
ncbi:hypothetical protein CBP31_14005 [Oceanisphaera profunda]|uniref:Uncharacterized protein n=1 Tax=Oceanisphaera profunda TaxID=1416627 RepID=A0A1Y0D9A3_9GAMM|nr:hypothetical protein [Oceanisphaera profunda]ART83605.1 hypothetical protein CBP31_14005 [Oceanisphaera profunda]